MTNKIQLHNKAKQRQFFYILIVLGIFLAYVLLRHYLVLIGLTAVLAVIFYPLYSYLLKVFKGRQSPALTLTIVTLAVTIILPVSLIISLVVSQAISLSNELSDLNDNGFISVDTVTNEINQRLEKLPYVEERIEPQEITDFITNALEPIAGFAFTNVINISNTAVNSIAIVVLFLMLFSAMLTNKEAIVRLIKSLSPLDDEVDNLYLRRLQEMSKAMVKGVFVIALVNTLLTGLLLWIVGVDFVAFLMLLTFFFSLLPLGAGVTLIPIGVVLLASGNYWQGALLIISYLLVISNLDQVLRPRLVPKEHGLHPALTVLAVFGGLKLFGFFGILFGPIIMIFIVTTIEVYVKYFNGSKHTGEID